MPSTSSGPAQKEWLLILDSLSRLSFIDLVLSEPKMQFNNYFLNPRNRKMTKTIFPPVVYGLIRKERFCKQIQVLCSGGAPCKVEL